jgi:Tfp pilus assembly protein PilZ
MRLLTLAFASASEFLAHSAEIHGHVLLFARTKTEAPVGESLLIEIAFPGLPNRALLRAAVKEHKGQGLWLVVDAADQSTADFVIALAHGEIEIKAVERSHGRFPASLPVSYTLTDGAAGEATTSTVEDLSTGGAFIRAVGSPPIGSAIELVIGPIDDDGERFTAHGHVAWIRDEPGSKGFGVEFEMPHGEDGRTLRRLLRHASETGKVDFAE